MQQCEYICFGGGSCKGVTYLGAIRAWERYVPLRLGMSLVEYCNQLKGFAGTSIGSIVALGLMLDLSAEQLSAIFSPYMSSPRSYVMSNPDVTRFVSEFGIDDGDRLRAAISNILREGGLCEHITFQELKRLLRRNFVCVATNLATTAPVHLSAETTPALRVVDGIYMSMCLPLVLAPLRYDGQYHIDGACSENMPRCFPPERTFHVDVEHRIANDVEITDVQQYFIAVMRMTVQPTKWFVGHSHMIVPIPDSYDRLMSKGQDFELTEPIVRDLVASGYAAVTVQFVPDVLTTLGLLIRFLYAVGLEAYSTSEEGCVGC